LQIDMVLEMALQKQFYDLTNWVKHGNPFVSNVLEFEMRMDLVFQKINRK
jgi:hypothetical protein